MVFQRKNFNVLEDECFKPGEPEKSNGLLKKALLGGLGLSVLALSVFAPWYYNNRKNHDGGINNVVQTEEYTLDNDLKNIIDSIGKKAEKPLDFQTLAILVGSEYIAGDLFGELDGHCWSPNEAKGKLFEYVNKQYVGKQRDRIKYVLENYYFVKPTEPKQEYREEECIRKESLSDLVA